jgi:hypothetical protein
MSTLTCLMAYLQYCVTTIRRNTYCNTYCNTHTHTYYKCVYISTYLQYSETEIHCNTLQHTAAYTHIYYKCVYISTHRHV